MYSAIFSTKVEWHFKFSAFKLMNLKAQSGAHALYIISRDRRTVTMTCHDFCSPKRVLNAPKEVFSSKLVVHINVVFFF